jgi:hypothetical protein
MTSRLRDFVRQRKRDVRFRLLHPARYVWEVAASSPRAGVRLLLASDGREPTSEEQYHPFSAFRTPLRQDARIVSTHWMLGDVLALPARCLSSFDALGLKLSFRTGEAEAMEVVRRARAIAGKRPLIYFDGDDDLCVRYPAMLPCVNLYVKKHVFSDPHDYFKSYVGKSNLTDYVHRRFGLSFADDAHASATAAVAPDQIDKILPGWNLALDSNILALSARVRAASPPAERTVDVMFRGAVPNNWMKYLRQDIEPAMRRLGDGCRVIVPTERVDKEAYYREMMRSRICVSPFGYGEICWRDVEAMLCGCVVVKPDMGHVRTVPDIFKPGITYVPIRWDYADLEEKCLDLLAHPEEQRRIAAQAFAVLESYYRERGFLGALNEILQRVGLRG